MSSYHKLSKMDFDNESDEREGLIDVLTDWYPYPVRFWKTKTTDSLWAVYLKGCPEEKQPKASVKEFIESIEPPKEVMRHGQRYIRLDSGGYIIDD